MIKKSIPAVIAFMAITCYANMYAMGADAPSQQGQPSQHIVVETQDGSLNIQQLIDACPEIAKSLPSKFVNKKIPGQIIKMNDKKYEVRYFGFEDTSGKLPESITFREYINLHKLSDMKSVTMDPLPGIHFESFDYRRVKLDDGVYFSMAVKLVG